MRARLGRAFGGEATLAAVRSGVVALVTAVAVAGCAGGPKLPAPSFLAKSNEPRAAEQLPVGDPLEAMNRKIHEGNQAFNHAVIYPLAKAYRDTLPEEARDRIDAFTTNLTEPMVLANNLLQFRTEAAMTTLARFITNSTVGLGGLYDVAETVGQKHQTGDFGQTLYVWGYRDSAYVVLPLAGPSSVRDVIGSGIEMATPTATVSKLPTSLATIVEQFNTIDTFGKPVNGLGKVEMLEELEASSLDFYTLLRSMAEQKREAELKAALAESLLFAPPKEVSTLAPGPARVDQASSPAASEKSAAAKSRSSMSVNIGVPAPAQ